MRSFIVVLFTCILFISCSQQASNEQVIGRETAESQKNADSKKKNVKKTILFFGNSLTAGMGLALSEAFPALIQQKIDSLQKPYQVVNAGLSGETSAGGLSRIDWVLKQPIDIFVLELGANDGLRGLSLEQTSENLQMILDKVKAKNPEVKLVVAGMEMPPSMGKEYIKKFRDIFPKLAEDNHASLVPFLLYKVAGEPSLNQQDGIHPNEKGEKIVAENVWKSLKPLL